MLRQHAFIVRMSEDYESEFAVNGKVDSVTSCLLNVETADVLVCILDRRYGPPLPPAHAYAGISATHAEIVHAQARGKRVFTFVRERSYVDHEQIRETALGSRRSGLSRTRRTRWLT